MSITGSPEPTGTARACAKHWPRSAPATFWSSTSSTVWPARSPTPGTIADELTKRHVKLNIGGSVYDPTDPIGKLLFTVLSMIAEFEADLARMRTREGMAIAKAKGRLRGKKPKLSPSQEAHLVELHQAGRHTTTELAELFNVARSTVYRAIRRAAVE